MVLNAEQIEEARRLRNDEDRSYADVAEHFGLGRSGWQQAKDAIHGTGDYAGTGPQRSKLEELTAAKLAEPKDADTGMSAEIDAAKNARKLTVDEVRQVNLAYEAGLAEHEIGDALAPPVNQLAIVDVLSHQGYVQPDQRIPPWSTATKEGEAKARALAATFTLGQGAVFEPEKYVAAA